MSRLSKKFLILILSIFPIIFGCGGGGSGAPSSSNPPPGGPGPGPGSSSPETRLFYTSDIRFVNSANQSTGLWAVDPQNLSNPVQVESGIIIGAVGIMHGTWEATNKRLIGRHKRTILYGKSDGKMYKVSALKGDALTPAQVSLETRAAKICNNPLWEEDFADHDKAIYIYELPGPDDNCTTSDDNILKMIRLGMGPTESPLTIPKDLIKNVHIPLWDKGNGALIGWLVQDGQNITRCDSNFQNCNPVTPITNPWIGYDPDPGFNVFSGLIILRIDKNLHAYDVSTGSLSPSLITLPSGSMIDIDDAVNEASTAYLYYSDGATLLKLYLDGSSNPQILVTETRSITSVRLTTNRVLYTLAGPNPGSDETLKVIDKNGGIPSTLLDPIMSQFLAANAVRGNWIYYSEGTTIAAIRDDGTGWTEWANSKWAGNTRSTTVLQSDGRRIPDARIIRIEDCLSTSNCSGGILKSFDPYTNSGAVILGTIPLDIAGPLFSGFYIGGTGYHALGTGSSAQGTQDLFYANASQISSLVRITNTLNISESWL